MNTANRLLQSMRRNPRDWRLENLQTVARQHGVTWEQNGTSHCVFRWTDGRTLSVPAHGAIKPVYVKQFLFML
jgi:hypothetical protein